LKLNNISNSDSIKKRWKEPQLSQLDIKETKNGATPGSYENNVYTKHGPSTGDSNLS